MDFYQLLCGFTVMIILSSKECHSQKPRCGLASKNTRIVGGQDAPPGAWPWIVSLHDDVGAFCAGSLITDQWVLTTAHCIKGAYGSIHAYMGRHNKSGANPNEVSRATDGVIYYPSFDELTSDHDIGLLKLSAPVNSTDYIYPICLASANSSFHSGTNSWVAGWGLTETGFYPNILQEVNVPIVGNNECKCAYPEITENMICAGLKTGGKDACVGDSGAPLVTRDGPIWVQSGIVAFGRDCGLPYTPGGYTRVSQYQDWISNVTGSSEPGFVTFTSPGVDSDLNFTCPAPPTTTITSTTSDKDGSVFDSGENVIHFSHFSHFTHFLSLCVLVYFALTGW